MSHRQSSVRSSSSTPPRRTAFRALLSILALALLVLLAACGTGPSADALPAGPSGPGAVTVLEPEAASLEAAYAARSAAGASGGGYIEARPLALPEADDAGYERTAIPFTIERAGDYALWVRASAAEDADPRAWFGVERGASEGDRLLGERTLEPSAEYAWTRVERLDLDRGEHRLALGAVGAGVRIDAFALAPVDVDAAQLDRAVNPARALRLMAFEAEAAAPGLGFEPLEDILASGATALVPVTDGVSAPSTIDFEVAREGEYELWARLRGGSSSALRLGFGGAELEAAPESDEDYGWVRLGAQRLGAGDTAIRIVSGRAEVHLDALAVTAPGVTLDDLDALVDTGVETAPDDGTWEAKNGGVSLHLIDADRDRAVSDFAPIADGAVIDLEALSSRKLNVEAVASGAESIVFRLNGSKIRTESFEPFAMRGDNDGDFKSWTPSVGSYTLEAIAYSRNAGKGDIVGRSQVRFEVVEGAPQAPAPAPTPEPDEKPEPEVGADLELRLIDANDDGPIDAFVPLEDGAVLDLSRLPSRKLNIEAVGAGVESVRFLLDGVRVRTESFEPFALRGDDDGDFKSWTPSVGSYTLEAIAYSRNAGKGDIVSRSRVRFDVVDGGPAPQPDPSPEPASDPTPDPTPAPSPSAPAGAGTSYPNHSYYDGVRAFPGAEGYGANATGGRGGRVMFITNRNDSGPGSARAAFEADGRRIVVPLVWGYADLEEGIRVSSGNLTYAGQFMPRGNGLALRNVRDRAWGSSDTQTTFYVRNADNLILRYLKVYRGVHTRHPDIGSSVMLNDVSNAIIDHSAVAFGNDEGIAIWGGGSRNVTVQHSWSVEPLHDSTHPKTLDRGIEHGMGMQFGGGAREITSSRNYFYLVGMRTPRFTGFGSYDLVNNYAYNVGSPLHISSRYTSDQRLGVKANVIGNMWDGGPIGDRRGSTKAMRIRQDESAYPVPSAYLEGNISPRRPDDRDTSVSGQWEGVDEGRLKSPIRLRSRVNTPSVRTTSAERARDEILTWGGPSWVVRDGKLVDVRDGLLERAARNARQGTGPNKARTGYGSGKDWEYPSLPSGSISEREFWNEYFGPWRDANYPGREWSDVVGGYMVLEHYLNSWVPDFPSTKF